MKLTKKQLDLLKQVVSTGQLTCWDSYPPAKKLVELGLAEWRRGRYSDCLVATAAGKDAVRR